MTDWCVTGPGFAPRRELKIDVVESSLCSFVVLLVKSYLSEMDFFFKYLLILGIVTIKYYFQIKK